MQSIYGMPIVVSELAQRKVIRRVRGGYMNRWLIRAEVWEPCAYMVAGNQIVMHPDLYEKLRIKAVAETMEGLA